MNIDTNEPSHLQYWSRLLSCCSASAVIGTYCRYMIQSQRADGIASATQDVSAHALYTLINDPQQSLYVALRGRLHTDTPIPSTYARPPVKLVYQDGQRADVYDYALFGSVLVDLVRVFTRPVVRTVQAISSRLITDAPTHNGQYVTDRYRLHVSQQCLLTAEHRDTTQLIAQHTDPPTQTVGEFLLNFLFGRLLLYRRTKEYGIPNDTYVTVIGRVRAAAGQEKQLEIVDTASIDHRQPTIISRQSYSDIVAAEQAHARAWKRAATFCSAVLAVSTTVWLSTLSYKLYHKRRTLLRMQQLQAERLARVQQMPSNGAKTTSDDIQGICVICYDRKSDCVFVDCFHQCCCLQCAEQLMKYNDKCPMCQRQIQQYRVPLIV